MDRCTMAYEYHKQGFNCAQSVVAAFTDLTKAPVETAAAMAGGIGGGVGGSHAEMCGALSGAVMVLGLLYPHTEAGDTASKKQVYAKSKEFRQRFEEIFGKTRCGELLAARPGVSDRTPAAQRMGITGHCDIMIVTAVEILEEMLAESAKNSRV